MHPSPPAPWSSAATRLALVALAACSTGGTSSAPTSGAPTTPAASAPSSAPRPEASAAPLAPDDPLDGRSILRDATFLAEGSFRGRGSGTEDEARAGAWLVEQLDRAKVPKAWGQRTAPFDYLGQRKSANVLGVVEPEAPGKPGVLVLGAHYDHVGVQRGQTYFGAEDNASGTAVVLAAARALMSRRAELGRTVVIAFFGAEEQGLHGSKAFMGAWPLAERPITLMVNVDMIGRSLVDQPLLWLGARALGVLSDVDPEEAVGAWVPDAELELQARVRAACKAEGVTAITPSDLPPTLRKAVDEMSRGRGDHAPFERKGIPFVFFSSGESTDYHQPTDTADKLDASILGARARAIVRFVLEESRR